MFIESKPVDLLRHYSRISYKEIHILKRFSSIMEDRQGAFELFEPDDSIFYQKKEKREVAKSDLSEKREKFFKKQ